MTLTELRYVVAVARERHFGRAAASCFVTQPTLSVAIKKLEDELGVQIFERTQHDMTLTPIGRQLVEQAGRVLEEAKAVKLIAEEGKDPLKGQLRLGVIYTIGPYLLPKLIPVLNEEAPDLTLIVDEDFTVNLSEKLRQGEVDVVIVSTPFDVPSVHTRVLYREPFVIALPRDHPLGKKRAIKANDLARETLLLLRAGNCFRDQVMEACPACKADTFSKDHIQRTLEGSSIATIRQMVAAGSGVTVLPKTAQAQDEGMGHLLEFRPFSKPIPHREVALAYRESYPRRQVVALLTSAIKRLPLPEVRFS